VLIKTGLLPGKSYPPGAATLTDNESRRFYDNWVSLRLLPSKSLWTLGTGQVIRLPVAHGEGKFVTADKPALDRSRPRPGGAAILRRAGRRRQRLSGQPNGSELAIAGITDETGQVLGLMPTRSASSSAAEPDWTRTEPAPEWGDGLRLFRNAVEAAKG